MVLRRLHVKMRREKLRLFLSLVGDCRNQSLLDVGGAPGFGDEFKEFATHFGFRCTINLNPSQAKEAGGYAVVGDGCHLPFAAASFDWVFSNAVIEHVGGWRQQREFAGEIRRVARKGYFIATPNRHFPIDPHSLLPFFQFLPHNYQKLACRVSLRGWMRRQPQSVDLLSAQSLRELFPGARVLSLGLPWIGNNLVAFFEVEQRPGFDGGHSEIAVDELRPASVSSQGVQSMVRPDLCGLSESEV